MGWYYKGFLVRKESFSWSAYKSTNHEVIMLRTETDAELYEMIDREVDE